jgi:hypothetical protein
VLIGVLAAVRRPGLSGLALGAGTMLKLFPAALLPVVLGAHVMRRDWSGGARLGVGFVIVVGTVAAWGWAVAGPDSLYWLRYQEDRGLQLESVGASVLLALHVVAGLPVERNFDFGAVQVVAPGSAEIAAAAPGLQAILLAGAVALSVRRFRLDRQRLGGIPDGTLALASIAAIGAPLLASKVLSMQYVLWLLPLVPLLRGRLAVLSVLLAAATTAVFTADYPGLWHFSPPMVAVLVVRNVLLAVFVGVVIHDLWTGAGPRTAAGVAKGLSTSSGRSQARVAGDARVSSRLSFWASKPTPPSRTLGRGDPR